jgi:proteasome alpha subunit
MEGMPDFMGYDRAIVTFSPDGRLFQVEYAREAVKRGSTCLGVVYDKGVILTAFRPTSPLSIPTVGSDKIHKLDNHLGASLSGFLADGRILVDSSRVKAQIYRLTYGEQINVMGAVREISDKMQLFTQYGGVRPYGVALLVGGVDENGPQLFEIDPSSAFYAWKAQSIGKGATEALKILQKEWKEGLSEQDAIRLALRALRAGEKGIKPSQVELAIISKGFKEFHGPTDMKFIKKFW